MKKYRALVPVVLIVLMLASWYLLVNNSMETKKTYESYLKEAREQAELGITKFAIQNYNLALEINNSPEIYEEVAQYYKSQNKQRDYVSWCENFFDVHPTSPKAYDCILDAYLLNKDYEACFDILDIAKKRNISSEFITKINEDLMYVFDIDFDRYDDVTVFSNNYCAVKVEDKWGFVTRLGEQRINCVYDSVGAFTSSELASVVNASGETYFIDKTGSKVKASKETYKSFGLLVDGKIPTEQTDGKYTYLNSELMPMFGEYDYASTYNGGIAAVKNGNNWSLIDENGKNITEVEYVDIKLDEKQIAFRNERAFVSKNNGEYIMVDTSGKQVGALVFEDARVFNGTYPTAVKIDGKWCFVDADGKLISKNKYDDARAFSNGLAAVCIGEKWGFVDLNEKLVIEANYLDAKDFNDKGSCFVKINNDWQLLKLYRLNRG